MKEQAPFSQGDQDAYDDAPAPRMGGGAASGLLKAAAPVLLIALAVAGIWWLNKPAAALAWHQEVDSAVDAARAAGKPVLMYFTADWCPPCQMFKKDVLTDSDVEKKLATQFVLLKVDLTDRSGPNSLIARDYGITGVPYFIVFDAAGRRLDAIAGAAPAGTFLAWLQQCQQRM